MSEQQSVKRRYQFFTQDERTYFERRFAELAAVGPVLAEMGQRFGTPKTKRSALEHHWKKANRARGLSKFRATDYATREELAAAGDAQDGGE